MKKALSFVLVLATLVSMLTVCSFSASAANYSTNYSAYSTPSNSGDYAKWNGSRMVKGSGTTTSEVKWMQAALNRCISYEGLNASYLDVDGKFGPASKKATMAFQRAAGLSVDGSFGPATIKKMKAVLNDGKRNSLGSSASLTSNAKYNLVWPVSTSVKGIGKITSAFGPRKSPTSGASSNHRGVDIGVAVGTDVFAAANGIVTAVGSTSKRGKYVVIYHEELNLSTLYQHLNSYDVKKGERVTAGEKIADSGKTGIGTGAHLHFGVMVGKATKVDHDQPGYAMAIDPCGANISYRNYK